MQNVITEITINEKCYSLCKMNADDGAFLMNQMMGVLLTAVEGEATERPSAPVESLRSPEEAAAATIRLLLTKVDRALFKEMKRCSLAVVFQMEWVNGNAMPLPVILYNGTYAIKEMEFDTGLVMKLMQESLIANFAPYFKKNELTALIMGSSSNSSNQSDTPT
jgi:hypothetical protein